MEFWTHKNVYSPLENRAVIDTAHRLGQKIVGAEAFTSAPEFADWHEHPAWLKPIGDAAFCDGVNRVNIHHFVQQPWGPEHRPGNAMGQWGIHLGRYQTWWEPGKAWFTYLWRCQALLQAGQFVPASGQTSVNFSGKQGALDLSSIHRAQGKDQIYFIANIARVEGSATCSFPDLGFQPELWDPVWGTMRDLQPVTRASGRLAVELVFAPAQSFFVVFRKPLAAQAPAKQSTKQQPMDLSTNWTVQFDPRWGGPASIKFAALDDWSKRSEKGIKFYSGTARYTKAITLPKLVKNTRYLLDLGSVQYIATVTVNGKQLGVVWTAPWRIDIASALVAGENTIEIAVANGWANRLIGDEKEPADIIWAMGDPVLKGGYFLKELPPWFLKNEPRPSKERYTFTTWNYFHTHDTLAPSGLLGPVQLLTEG